MDSSVVNAILVIAAVVLGGVALKLGRKFFAKAPSFVYKGKEPLNNSFNGAKSQKIMPGQTIPSRSFFEFLKSMFFSGKGYLESQNVAHIRWGKFFASPYFVGTYSMLMVADAEAARKIVLSSVDHFPKAQFDLPKKSQELMGIDNVVFKNGEDWKRQRNALNSSFFDLSRYMSIFHETTLEAFDAIEKERAGRSDSSIVQHDLLMSLTLDVLGRAVFKFDFGTIRGEAKKEVDAYLYAFRNVINPLDIVLPFWSKLPTPGNRKYFESTGILHNMLQRLLASAKEKMKKMEETHQKLSNEEITILDQMVQAGLSEKELKDNAIILFIAGHETSANALAMLMADLAVHQDIQQKLYDAVLTQIGVDGVTNLDKLNGCNYLDMVIKETLRLHGPITQLGPRELTQDEEINGIVVPKGTMVHISVSAIHHSSDYWPNPEEFNPDRFLPEVSKGRPSMAFMPFGAGKRVCLGMQFAMVEMKCFIALLLLQYRLEPAIGFERVVLHKSHDPLQSIERGFRVRIVPRK